MKRMHFPLRTTVSLIALGLSACGASADEAEPGETAELASASTASGYDTDCWRASVWDRDGDGYADDAAGSADRETVPGVLYADKLSCPVGWVAARGDCDDGDAQVHPRRWEVAGNGVDDDCNGAVDDHGFYYLPNGWDVSDDGFSLYLRVADDGAAAAAWAGPLASLSYAIIWAPLEDTSDERTTPIQPVTGFWDAFGVQTALLRLEGLEDGKVYRARVQLYRSVTRLSRFDGRTTTTHTAIGALSAWYYGMTSSALPAYSARTRIVNRALYERYRSEHEQVGYRGTDADGTDYGASEGEAWCSEFYTTVAGHELDALSSIAAWFDVMTWFADRGNLVTVDDSNRVLVQWLAQPGDYLAEDTDLDGDTNHSAMFLAWDRAQSKIITLDGNASGRIDWSSRTRLGGNEVSLRTQELDVVDGWGWIDSDMLP